MTFRGSFVFDDVANSRIFVRYEMEGPAGWVRHGQGMYKWGIDTGGQQTSVNPSGTQISNEEYFLYVWDGGVEDFLGEVNLARTGPDGVTGGFPPIIGPDLACGSDCVGTGSPNLGGPQIANNNPDIGYRLFGNVVEMYVTYSALGSTSGNPLGGIHDLCFIMTGEGTATNENLDQTNFCDNTANAVGPVTEGGVFCGSAPGALTIVKDTVPDYAPAEFRFEVQGNPPGSGGRRSAPGPGHVGVRQRSPRPMGGVRHGAALGP